MFNCCDRAGERKREIEKEDEGGEGKVSDISDSNNTRSYKPPSRALLSTGLFC